MLLPIVFRKSKWW